jgi:predicted Zn-dependent peptidase
MYKRTILDNGLRIISNNLKSREAVSLGIWIGVGGRFEPDADRGISHYLEHMLFKGSKKYCCQDIKESIEGKGGYLNAFTAEEFTCYLVKVLKNNLYESLDILSDMVLNPVLDEEEINKERTVIIEEIKMYKDLPQHFVLELLDELLWSNHPLGQNLAGTIETVSAIDKLKLSNFQKKFYRDCNIVISVCGAFDSNKLTSRVKKIFSNKQIGQIINPSPIKDENLTAKIKCLNKDTEQSHLALGFRSYNRSHPDRFALDLLNIIMGANMSSRLFQEVREKRGLAYAIGSNVKRFKDTGAFIVHAGVDNRKVEDAVGVIAQELEKVKKGVNLSEFKRAKDFYLGQLIMSLEDVSDYMLLMGESIMSLDRVYTLKEIKAKVTKVTISDIKRVAKETFDLDNINLSLISPAAEDKAKALGEKFKT